MLPYARPMATHERAATPATPFSGEARPGFVGLIVEGVGELIRHNRLIIHLVRADLKRTHADTVIGQLWWIIDPFLQMAIYTLLVTVIFQRKIEDAPLFLFCTILPWKWFQTTLNDTVTSVTSRNSLIRQVKFPKIVLPTAATLAGAMSYVFGLVSLAALYVLYSHRLSHWLITIPVIAFVEFVFMLSLAIFFSAANAFYRDIQNVLRHILRLWFYASPTIYSMDQLQKSGMKDILSVNPFTIILESFRNVSYGAPLHPAAPDWGGLAGVLAVSVVLLLLSIGFFKRVENSFAKIL